MIRSQKQQALESSALTEQETVFSGKLFSVRKDTLSFEDLPSYQWEIIEHPGAVALLPINDKGELLLVQQWRRPIESILYEIPAGTLEKDEPLLEAAQRELQEEVGVKAKALISLGTIFSAPGFCTEQIHLYLAQGLEESSLPQDQHEAIDITPMTIDQALELVDDEKITDSKTLCALFRYQRYLQKHA